MDQKNTELLEKLQAANIRIDELCEENVAKSDSINQLEAENEHAKDALVKVRKEKSWEGQCLCQNEKKIQ